MGVVVERKNGQQMVGSEGKVSRKFRLLFTFHYFSFQQILESDEIGELLGCMQCSGGDRDEPCFEHCRWPCTRSLSIVLLRHTHSIVRNCCSKAVDETGGVDISEEK